LAGGKGTAESRMMVVQEVRDLDYACYWTSELGSLANDSNWRIERMRTMTNVTAKAGNKE
jgi:hypothetical protein